MIRDFFLKGGILMYPLLVFSIIAIAAAAEKIFDLKKVFINKALADAILDIAQKNISAGRQHSVVKPEGSQSAKTAIAELIKTNYSKTEKKAYKNSSLDLIAKIANSQYDANIAASANNVKIYNAVYSSIESKSFSKIHILDLIGKIAPMTGLAGTVIGLAKTFQLVSLSGQTGDAAMLAGGIWEAMITTIAGLVIAIPVIIISHLLKNSFENNLERLRQCCIAVMQAEDKEFADTESRESSNFEK